MARRAMSLAVLALLALATSAVALSRAEAWQHPRPNDPPKVSSFEKWFQVAKVRFARVRDYMVRELGPLAPKVLAYWRTHIAPGIKGNAADRWRSMIRFLMKATDPHPAGSPPVLARGPLRRAPRIAR